MNIYIARQDLFPYFAFHQQGRNSSNGLPERMKMSVVFKKSVSNTCLSRKLVLGIATLTLSLLTTGSFTPVALAGPSGPIISSGAPVAPPLPSEHFRYACKAELRDDQPAKSVVSETSFEFTRDVMSFDERTPLHWKSNQKISGPYRLAEQSFAIHFSRDGSGGFYVHPFVELRAHSGKRVIFTEEFGKFKMSEKVISAEAHLVQYTPATTAVDADPAAGQTLDADGNPVRDPNDFELTLKLDCTRADLSN
jgi:hypothetical protein